jgi:hypothetical protein
MITVDIRLSQKRGGSMLREFPADEMVSLSMCMGRFLGFRFTDDIGPNREVSASPRSKE